MKSIKISIPSLMENIKIIESFIDNAKEKYTINEDIYGNIMISVTECVTNAIVHGNQLDGNKKVDLELKLDEDSLHFTIVDEGPGFDYENLSDPTSPKTLKKVGGRGIFIMKHLSDDVKFEDKGKESSADILPLSMAILFFEEDIKFSLPDKNKHKKWLREIAANEHYTIEELNYIFCSDEYLLKVNQEYLNHNTYTDIITFDNSDIPDTIISDIFISIDRVKENASKENTSFQDELLRVMSHGLLHLVGYKDKLPEDKRKMRAKEDQSIGLFKK